ncbi:hypothetical protein BKA70DRAFT_1442390 [Coprinopsis sp. MPI-PUGE-AT-0042]|nr:hypothetical protein BKA70DRAFT_1442390 [Coprinopsis sp. MPI-PUGE-AT-0042]
MGKILGNWGLISTRRTQTEQIEAELPSKIGKRHPSVRAYIKLVKQLCNFQKKLGVANEGKETRRRIQKGRKEKNLPDQVRFPSVLYNLEPGEEILDGDCSGLAQGLDWILPKPSTPSPALLLDRLEFFEVSRPVSEEESQIAQRYLGPQGAHGLKEADVNITPEAVEQWRTKPQDIETIYRKAEDKATSSESTSTDTPAQSSTSSNVSFH